ncbi:unnamed protein product [Hymenolepis diminuta]|uniref:Uncharacterized protein n=1 Tax=Hymenolepis diminuta TaxID=6216 RepID=A0A564XWL8_HYMDI|nr:unnamed protein product [Hymenolepis diminuta]
MKTMEMNSPPRGTEKSIVNALLTHSLGTPECGSDAWHGMMGKIRGMLKHNILLNVFKCLKQQQKIRNIVHQDLRYKACTFSLG